MASPVAHGFAAALLEKTFQVVGVAEASTMCNVLERNPVGFQEVQDFLEPV